MATSRSFPADRNFRPLPVVLASMLVLAPAAAVAGGADGNGQYLPRRDTIALGAGDAVQMNITTHTIDPWPWNSRNHRLKFDGDRMYLGITRYKANESIEPRGLTTQDIIESNGGGGGPGGR